jgi:hypothetical protein
MYQESPKLALTNSGRVRLFESHTGERHSGGALSTERYQQDSWNTEPDVVHGKEKIGRLYGRAAQDNVRNYSALQVR